MRIPPGTAVVNSGQWSSGTSSWFAASATSIAVLANQRLRVRRVGSATWSVRDLAKTAWRKLTSSPLIHPALHAPQTFVTRRAIRASAESSRGPRAACVARQRSEERRVGKEGGGGVAAQRT